MTRRRLNEYSFLIVLVALAFAGAFSSTATAIETYKAGKIIIGQAWAAETPNKAKTGVVYFKLGNSGRKADTLLAASSPVADKVELHANRLQGNVVRMRHILGITIGPRQTFTLKPGGTHVMLIGLKRPLKAGDRIPLTLVFRDAGTVQIHVTVGKPPGMRGGPPKQGRNLESYRK